MIKIKVRDDKDQINIAKVDEAGQEHIFRFWDDLDADGQRALLDQVATIDFHLVEQLARTVGEKPRVRGIEPPVEILRAPVTDDDRARDRRFREAGEAALDRGQVAGLIVAGGQGTRLGYGGPKGCFPIGPVSERSLFQVFAEKALAAARRHKSSFPLYIMTSAQSHDDVVAFWREHEHFGLSPAEVFFFTQRELPAVDRRGRVLMAEKGRVAVSPNGHGGVLLALSESGALEDMAKRGVEFVSYWQVDNPLVRVADPLFLGAVIERGADAAAKVAVKRGPLERVGVFGLIDGKIGVIEYSELSDEEAHAIDEAGRLRFGAGNLAIHAFRRSFLDELLAGGDPLPYHQASKKVVHVDRHGERVTPEEPNGVKFELFVFDAFATTDKVVLLEVDRAEEFSPVKNKEGADSPATCRAALSKLYANWLRAAGAEVADGEDGSPAAAIEISPLTAESPAELEKKIEPGLSIHEAVAL